MGSTLNMVYSGGGLFPTLVVTITNGTATSVTATLGSKVVNLTYDSAAGAWRGTLKAFGTWTVEATDGDNTVSDTVNVTNVAVYQLSVSMPRLPSGYTELEYLQSTGTQYIDDTTATTSTNSYFEVDCYQEYNNINAQYGLFGWINSNDPHPAFGVTYYPYPGCGFLIRSDTVSNYRGTGSITTGRHTVGLDSSYRAIFDGTPFGNTIGAPTASTYAHFGIFAVLGNSGSTLYQGNFTGRIYSAIHWKGGAEYRHYYPARRNSDSVLGMYDTVSGTFYTNAGSGTFIAGPEVTA